MLKSCMLLSPPPPLPVTDRVGCKLINQMYQKILIIEAEVYCKSMQCLLN